MASDRPSFTDTWSGFDPDHEDRVEAALEHLDAAMARLGRSIEELRKRSDPPPDPGAPAGAMKAAA